MKLDTNRELIEVDGMLVESDALRVAEALKAYDPNLEVICVDPDKAEVNEAPFLICEYVNGAFRRIFETWVLDNRVLDRIKLSDTQSNNILLNIDKTNEVNYQRKQQRFKDILNDKNDLVLHIVKDKKSRYSYKDEATGEKVTMFDDRPAERHAFPLSKK